MDIPYIKSYNIMLEIVDFSSFEPGYQQSNCIDSLLNIVENNIVVFSKLSYHITSIGDGLIISLIEERSTENNFSPELPLQFVKNVLKDVSSSNFQVRVSLHLCSKDRLLERPFLGLPEATKLLTGGGINFVRGLIHFSGPGEIIMSDEYKKSLTSIKLSGVFNCEPFFVYVKEAKKKEIFSYVPTKDENTYICNIKDDKMNHHKYAFFPPIDANTYKKIASLGIEDELKNICDYAYDNLDAINSRRIIISMGSIFKVLKNVPTEQEDEVLVVSREDIKNDFWSSDEADSYLKHLEKNATIFNQRRLFIYDSYNREDSFSEKKKRLLELHARGTMKGIDQECINSNILLKYIYGVTIYPKLGCAIAPLPPTKTYNDYMQILQFTKPEHSFLVNRNYDFKHVFRALVIANESIVQRLVTDFYELFSHKQAESYK